MLVQSCYCRNWNAPYVTRGGGQAIHPLCPRGSARDGDGI